jgi:hypothetical protein
MDLTLDNSGTGGMFSDLTGGVLENSFSGVVTGLVMADMEVNPGTSKLELPLAASMEVTEVGFPLGVGLVDLWMASDEAEMLAPGAAATRAHRERREAVRSFMVVYLSLDEIYS